MCGLLGVYCLPRERAIKESRFLAARDVMASRGPDSVGFDTREDSEGRLALMGHRRLSIQDLSDRGSQPMRSACGRYSIIYNGEVYNAALLRRRLEESGCRFRTTTDTEVILEGFARWGRRLPDLLHGMFAFAIFDGLEGRVTLVRDRLGIKPLFLARDGGALAVASDARALRALGYGAELDGDGLALYLGLGYVPAPKSIWRGIEKLDPATILEWSPTREEVRSRYWSAPDDVDGVGRLDDLSSILDGVVEEQLVSDVDVGLFLSGGLNSSIVASSLPTGGRTRERVTALCVGYPESPRLDESPLARRTALALGMPIKILPMPSRVRPYYDEALRALDEPLAFDAVVTQTAISGLAAGTGLKVVLSGDGGDELFGGYRWYESAFVTGPGEPKNLLKRMSPYYRRARAEAERDQAWRESSPLALHAQSVHPGLRPSQIAGLVGRRESEVRDLLLAALGRYDCAGLPPRLRRQRIDLYTFCMAAVLAKVDRAGMAHGIEVRPPLLDHRVIDWAFSHPETDRGYGATSKAPLRALLSDRDLGFLLDAPKRGFSLRSREKPSIREMRADISAMSQQLGLAENWQRLLPPRTRHYRQRLRILHWLALWRRVVGAAS